MLYIVGLGPGGKEYILDIATKTMEKSDVVIGFKRAIETINHIKTPKLKFKKLNQIITYIENNQNKNISLIASGDPTFYGITDYIKKNYNGEIKIIPGISSFQYFMSSIGKTWNNVYLGSLHGKDEFMEIEDEFIKNIIKHSGGIFLTDDKISPDIICKSLYENKINGEVYIGENLSYNNEKISHGSPEEFMNLKFSDLSVIYIEIL
jgi:cobalt-precorrin-7 (C5)-methyltransferase